MRLRHQRELLFFLTIASVLFHFVAEYVSSFEPSKPSPEHPKRNEYLVPWEEVPDAIKQLDRDLVRGIPTVLARAGYTVVNSMATSSAAKLRHARQWGLHRRSVPPALQMGSGTDACRNS